MVAPASMTREQLLQIVQQLTPDQRKEYEERAAIREYDGCQIRGVAERDALAEIVSKEEP